MQEYSTLIQIKCFQRKHDLLGKIIPHRYRIVNAWCKQKNNTYYVQEVGHNYWWPFPDGFCPNYLGEFQAIILQESVNPKIIDNNRSMESGVFETLDFQLIDDKDEWCH